MKQTGSHQKTTKDTQSNLGFQKNKLSSSKKLPLIPECSREGLGHETRSCVTPDHRACVGNGSCNGVSKCQSSHSMIEQANDSDNEFYDAIEATEASLPVTTRITKKADAYQSPTHVSPGPQPNFQPKIYNIHD